MKFIKKLLGFIFIVFSALFLIGIFVGDVENSNTFKLELSDEFVEHSTSNGISVKIPPLFFEDEAGDLSIKELPAQKDDFKKIDVSIGDLHEFSDYLEIKVPLSQLNLSNPHEELEIYSYNPSSGERQKEYFEVIGDDVVIYTDHLTEFEFSKNKSNVKLSNSLNLSDSEIVKTINSIESGMDSDAAFLNLGFKGLETTVSWAGNFATYGNAIEGTTKFYDGIAKLGNSIFYIKSCGALYDSVAKGSSSPILKHLKSDALGFIIGKWGTPGVQVAFVSYNIAMYVGEQTIGEYVASSQEKYIYAYNQMQKQYLMQKYKESNPTLARNKWKRDVYKQLQKSAETAKDLGGELGAEFIKNEVEKIAEDFAKLPLNNMDTDAFYEKVEEFIVEKKSKTDFKDAFDVIDWIKNSNANTFTEKTKEKLVKDTKKMLIYEMKPILTRLSHKLMIDAKKEYQKELDRFIKEINTKYKVKFEVKGNMPSDITDALVEFYLSENGESVWAKDLSGNKTLSTEMSIVDVANLKNPNRARLILIRKDGVDKYEIPFKFKTENQTITFKIDYPEEEEKKDDEEDKEKPDNDDDSVVSGDMNITGIWDGQISIAFEDVNWSFLENNFGDTSELRDMLKNSNSQPFSLTINEAGSKVVIKEFENQAEYTVNGNKITSYDIADLSGTGLEGFMELTQVDEKTIVGTMKLEIQGTVIYTYSVNLTKVSETNPIDVDDSSDDQSEDYNKSFIGSWSGVVYLPKTNTDWNYMNKLLGGDVPKEDFSFDVDFTIEEGDGYLYMTGEASSWDYSFSGDTAHIVVYGEDGQKFVVDGKISDDGKIVDCTVKMLHYDKEVSHGTLTLTK